MLIICVTIISFDIWQEIGKRGGDVIDLIDICFSFPYLKGSVSIIL